MTLQERINEDFKEALKSGEKKLISDMKVIVGEIQRLPNKKATDDEVSRVLRKLMKGEEENLKLLNIVDADFVATLSRYLPEPATEDEIEQWIKNNINFGELRNKMQAIKYVLGYFGARADGNMVKKVLLERF